MRERKLKSLNFWKNAIRDSPEKEKEKVLEEKKLEKRVVRDCMFSLSENEKEYEDTKRCRPEKKHFLAAHLSSTNPEPHDTPPRILAEARKCTFWKGFEKAIQAKEKFFGCTPPEFDKPRARRYPAQNTRQCEKV